MKSTTTAAVPYTAIIMYANERDVKFDETYYMQTHMPLVEKVWKSYGLNSWHVTKFPQALDGAPSKYLIMATLQWASEEALQTALESPESGIVFGDIPNFTNKRPDTLAGAILGTGFE